MQILKFFSQLKEYNHSLKKILIWNMILCFGLGIHLVLYNLFLQGMLHDEMLVGKIIGLNFLAQALIYLPAGLYADKVGSKKGVMTGLAILIFSLLGNLMATSPEMLSVWGFLIGLGHAATIVMFIPLITEYSNSTERGSLYSFAFSTGTLFTFAGTLIAGFITDMMESVFLFSSLTSIKITLSLTVLLLLLCNIPLLLIKGKNIETEKMNQNIINLLIKNPSSLKTVFKFSISKAIAGVSLGVIAPFINLFFFHRYALEVSKISLILACGTLATVFFMSYNSKITGKLGEVKSVTIYHLLSVPVVILLGFTQNIWIAVLSFILFRSTKFALNPIESKLMMETVPANGKGLANSLGFMTNSLIISLLGPFSMYIVQLHGHNNGYLILCIISAIGSIVAAVYFQLAFKRKEVVATSSVVASEPIS